MKNKKVFVNASWMIGCKIAQSVFALIVNALSARYFGPSNFGLINYAASLAAFVMPLASLGTSEILVSEIIKNPENEGAVLGTSIAMNLVSSLVCIVGLFSFSCFAYAHDRTTILVVLFYSFILTAKSIEQIQYWFHAKYLSKFAAITSFFTCIVVSLYKIILLICKKNVYWFAVSYSVDYTLAALCLFVIYRKKNGPILRFSITAAKSLWNQGKYYIIPGMMTAVLAQSDRVMIRYFCGNTEVGYYSAAVFISGMTSFVFGAIITSFRTAIFEAKAGSKTEYESCIIKLYGIVIYLAVLQSMAVFLFSKLVVGILYGREYLPAIPILWAVVWYTVFSYIGAVNEVWILAEDKQKYLFSTKCFGVLLNLFLNLVLIPRYHGIGAAVATLITQAFTNVVMVYYIKPLRNNLKFLVMGLNIRNLVR